MNWLALFDGLLAVTAFWIAASQGRHAPALRLGCVMLGVAAVLGTLRFSGLLALPAWHQFFSMLGAAVALPLLALATTDSSSVVASQRRYAWIFAVSASVAAVLIVTVFHFKVWTSLAAVASGLAILAAGVMRKQRWVFAAGIAVLAGLGSFATKLQLGELQPGDFLHIGLVASLLAIRQARLSSR